MDKKRANGSMLKLRNKSSISGNNAGVIYLNDTEDYDNVHKGSEQYKLEDVKVEEDERLKEQNVTGDVVKIEDSCQMELLSENELAKSGNSETAGTADDKIATEEMIMDALWNKATYFRAISEELMAIARRNLEEDLQLNKFSLDSFKKLISKHLAEVLNSESEGPNKTGHKSDVYSEEQKKRKRLLTEEENKEVKRRKKMAKVLEEIDTSNIIIGSRRKYASRFLPPPKLPNLPIESGANDSREKR
ncbi:uncharacterized protein [Rutidosis leptorrhynchoides]|uniref:uncharacterized protein n=1 Tax=Rutidosis leptorrhynchoides TaxID=125765 RepID=UPI003A99BEE8